MRSGIVLFQLNVTRFVVFLRSKFIFAIPLIEIIDMPLADKGFPDLIVNCAMKCSIPIKVNGDDSPCVKVWRGMTFLFPVMNIIHVI